MITKITDSNLINKKTLIREFFIRKIPLSITLIFLTVLESCTTIILSLSIGNYYEILGSRHSTKDQLMQKLHITLPHDPKTFFIAFAIIVIVKLCLQFTSKYFSELLASSFTLSLQNKLFRHHLKMNIIDFAKKPVGKYLLRYSGDINSIRHYLIRGVFHFISDCFFLLISLAVLLSFDITITLLIIAGLTIGFFLFIFLNSKLKKIQILHRNMLSSNLHFVNEGLKAIITFKLFNKEYSIIKKYKKRTDKLMGVNKQYIFFESVNHALPHALLSFTLLSVFIVHLHFFMGGSALSGESFIPCILLIILMFPIYHRFLEVSPVWQAGNISFIKIAAILNLPIEEDQSEIEFLPTKGLIEFNNVSFSYSGGKPLLINCNFCFCPGQINQLHGNYKSTILKLILGLYTPDSGSILFDGVDANLFSKKSIRNSIAFISEEVPLCGSTILRCLYLKNNEYNRTRALELLQLLNYSNNSSGEIIDLDAKIGEQGKYLSKSQYKKLIIARALLSDKAIILVDDALESLEADAQSNIAKLLYQLKDTHTIIVAGKVITENKNLLFLRAS